MTATLPFRFVRAAAFAVVCLLLGLVAHLLAGGRPSVPSVVAGLALSAAIALPATGRERSLEVILPLLAGAQIALHLLFSLGPAAQGTHLAGHAHTGLACHAGMLIAHGWAVGLTALWLARGEALLWGVLRRLTARLIRVVVAQAVPVLPRPVVPPAAPRPVRPLLLRHAVHRRGPPFSPPSPRTVPA